MNKVIKIIIIVLILSFPVGIKAQVSSLEPIVIVPGIMGSWNWDVFLDRSNPGTWDFFVADHTWDNLIDALEHAGYEKNVNLFVAFYDWRQSNINSVTDYLIPTINKALTNSPTGKVSIIAHSMGGLVARRYIQSNNYRDDVNKLIMLGTPNYGSSDVYTLWEAGFIPDNWSFKEHLGIGFYLWYLTTATGQTSDNYDTVHTFIPSIRELLPVYSFLTDSDGVTKSYGSLIDANNPFLENLDFSGTVTKLLDIGSITIVAGTGTSTVNTIPIINRPISESKLWVDGMPEPITPIRNSTNGDNRVLLSSAFLDEFALMPPVPVQNFLQKFFTKLLPTAHAQFNGSLDEFLKQIEINSKHGDLPTTAIPEVFKALALTPPSISYTPPPEPDNITSFWFASPVAVTVTDPQGRTISKDSNQIPDAIYTGESDPNGVKMVIIPNGLSGEYKVELLGIGNGKYHMAVTNFTNNSDNIVTVEKDVVIGEKIKYTTIVDNKTGLPAKISEPVITKPDSGQPPIGKSAIDLTNKLISDLEKYYKDGKIGNKGIYQSLLNDLKIVLGALEEAERTRPIGEKYPKLHELKVKLAERLAINKLESFISTIEKRNKKDKIDDQIADNLIANAKAIIKKI